MITLVLAFALATPSPTSIDAPRHAYAACLKAFENQSRVAKVDPAAYATAVKAACPSEAAALMKALVMFDVAMGTKRPTATSNAQRDIDDYQLTSEERYRDIMSN